MTEFEKAYQQLNAAQKKAVDTTDGPVLVIAGPGTGKTQLLSMRVANILNKTDALPQNVLCLTFTESGAAAMRERLRQLIGQTSYHVPVYTFHGFGSDIINRYPEHFGLRTRRPIDDLTAHRLITEILDTLPHRNPLSTKFGDEYLYARDIRSGISDLKRGGRTPSDLEAVLAKNTEDLDRVEDKLNKILNVPRLTKAVLEPLTQLNQELQQAPADSILSSCSIGLTDALAGGGTKLVTAWRNQWLEKNSRGDWVFKARKQQLKLQALAHVYELYQEQLHERGIFDFDDMVLDVVMALETVPELKYDLQEQYQYILIDEFQDTNDAQMRLAANLVDSPIHEGRPNIMVVGDDDQAIYRFQGALASNLLTFADSYVDPLFVTLTENYRSVAPVLEVAHYVAEQIDERLEKRLPDINKVLRANVKRAGSGVERHQFSSLPSELSWVAKQVQTLRSKQPDSQIAIIARKHQQLEPLLSHLSALDIPINYERQQDVLKDPLIHQLIQTAKLVLALASQKVSQAEHLLPEVASYPFWQIETATLWAISRESRQSKEHWLEVMQHSDDKQVVFTATFLLELARQVPLRRLESMLDLIIGSQPLSDELVSPFKSYYFSSGSFETARADYLAMLSNLTTLRQAVRNYEQEGYGDQLDDLVELTNQYEAAGLTLSNTSPHHQAAQTVYVMTAHRAKGQEFDHVFIINCQDEVWGDRARSRSRLIQFPANLPITPAGDHSDDRLRLFYVGLTRAKEQLYLSSHTHNLGGQSQLPLAALEVVEGVERPSSLQPQEHEPSDLIELTTQLEDHWHSRHHAALADNQALLAPWLEQYLLSATHLNTYTDIVNHGPQAWLTGCLLRFPQAMPVSAAFGSALHQGLQKLQLELAKSGKIDSSVAIESFKQSLKDKYLDKHDEDRLLERGELALTSYLKQCGQQLKDEQAAVEQNFRNQGVVIEEARLTGAIDRLELLAKPGAGQGQARVIDFKSGGILTTWNRGADHTRIKAHKYRQQLLFYKLLVERSRDFSRYNVIEGRLDFIEPDEDEQCHQLAMEYDESELAEFEKLILAVWRSINSLELPDVSGYDSSLGGIKAFEADLIKRFV